MTFTSSIQVQPAGVANTQLSREETTIGKAEKDKFFLEDSNISQNKATSEKNNKIMVLGILINIVATLFVCSGIGSFVFQAMLAPAIIFLGLLFILAVYKDFLTIHHSV